MRYGDIAIICFKSMMGDEGYEMDPGKVIFKVTKKGKVGKRVRFNGREGPLGDVLNASGHPEIIARFDAQELLEWILEKVE